MKEAFIKLEQKKAQLEKELKEVMDALKALQLVCEHEFQYVTTTHNDKIYDCTICGLTEKQ